MSKINKIRLSGTTYDIEDSGATRTVEVTQAQYDALVSGGTVDPNTFYVITDATAVDISQYWTSAETQSAITEATSGKVDTSTYETYTAATDTALSGKQDTLSAGTGIDITDNVISATGGGGTTYSAGTNISIDSSNNINCTIPLSAGTGTRSVKGGNYANASSDESFAFGSFVNADGVRSVAFGDDNRASKQASFVCGFHNVANGEIGSFATGIYNNSTSGQTDSGNTLFSVGNGTANNARHNAFEIKTNGDIYITSGSSDIKLQDHLGGGGGTITIDPSLDSGSTNAVANSAITEALEGKLDASAYTPTDLSEYWTSAQTNSAINAATSGKVNTNDVYTRNQSNVRYISGASVTTGTTYDRLYIKKGDGFTSTVGAYFGKINGEAFIGSSSSNVKNFELAESSAVTEEIAAAVSGKADTSAVTDSINAATSGKVDTTTFETYSGSVETALSGKQDTLISGTNIKTINNESILGSGNIDIQGGSDINVVQTTGTSTADVMSQNAITNAFNEYTVRKDSDNGIVRYWTWKNPNYPYGASSINNFAINGRCPLSKENGVNSSIWEFSLVETSAITSSVTSASTDTEIPTAKAVFDAMPQGASYSAGTNISIGTANTISCILNATNGGGSRSIIFGDISNIASSRNSFSQGNYARATEENSHAEGNSTLASGINSHAEGLGCIAYGSSSHAEGWYTKTNNINEHSNGRYNVSSTASTTFGHSGNTLFSVGNGTADNARHNAFEIRQNGDIYIEKGGSDVKLQDIIPSTTSAVTSGSTAVVESGAVYDQLGGMKIVKLTESEYTALVTKDSNTLYVVVPDA